MTGCLSIFGHLVVFFFNITGAGGSAANLLVGPAGGLLSQDAGGAGVARSAAGGSSESPREAAGNAV